MDYHGILVPVSKSPSLLTWLQSARAVHNAGNSDPAKEELEVLPLHGKVKVLRLNKEKNIALRLLRSAVE